MLLKTVYEKAMLSGIKMSAVEFVTAFNSFSRYLTAKYGEKLVCTPNTVYSDATMVDDDAPIRPVYEGAYLDYIVGTASRNDNKLSDAVVKAEYAYKTAWSENCHGKRIRKERWY